MSTGCGSSGSASSIGLVALEVSESERFRTLTHSSMRSAQGGDESGCMDAVGVAFIRALEALPDSIVIGSSAEYWALESQYRLMKTLVGARVVDNLWGFVKDEVRKFNNKRREGQFPTDVQGQVDYDRAARMALATSPARAPHLELEETKRKEMQFDLLAALKPCQRSVILRHMVERGKVARHDALRLRVALRKIRSNASSSLNRTNREAGSRMTSDSRRRKLRGMKPPAKRSASDLFQPRDSAQTILRTLRARFKAAAPWLAFAGALLAAAAEAYAKAGTG